MLCRVSTSSFTFIMQIMFGNPSLSLTYSWAAPEEIYEELASPVESGLPGNLRGSPSGSVNDEDFTIDEGELLGKPFELTLARCAAFCSQSQCSSVGGFRVAMGCDTSAAKEFDGTPSTNLQAGCVCRFLAGSTNDDEANQRRHSTLKLIPRISKGAWFVKQAVGTTPCLLGRKLTTHYHR